MAGAPRPAGARPGLLIGVGAGVVWSILLVWIGVTRVNLPVFTLLPTMASAFLGPGLVLAAMVGWLAAGRYADTHPATAPAPGSSHEVDLHVLRETVTLTVLSLALWPPLAYLLVGDGPGVVLCLGLGFTVARLAHWIGCHYAAPLRAFGFAASYFPTLVAAIWALSGWVSRLSG